MLLFRSLLAQNVSRKRYRVLVTLILLSTLLGAARTEAQVPISFGQTISASISTPGEEDEYSFVAAEGDTVIVWVSTAGSLDPSFQLIYPPPHGLYETDPNNPTFGPGVESIEIGPLEMGGTFTLRVRDFGGDETGEYGLCIQRVNNPVGATPINFGVTLPSSLDRVGEVDSYTFEGRAGDLMLLRITPTLPVRPILLLRHPDGSWLGNEQDWDYSDGIDTVEIITEPLPADGTYTLLAADDQFNETGAYSILVQRLNDPVNAAVVGFGETVPASIVAVGELDTLTFDAMAGDVVLVKVTTPSQDLDPEIRILRPDHVPEQGTVIYGDYFESGPATYDFTSEPLPSTGTYKVLINDFGDGRETGDYTIFVQRLNNPDRALPIGFGELKSGSLDQVGEVDTYTFDAIVGDMVMVKVTTAGNLGLNVMIRQPDGSDAWDEYFESGPYTVEIIVEPDLENRPGLIANGTHSILISDHGDSTETGNYTIFVQRLNNPGLATPLGDKQTISSSIDPVGMVDTYTFDAIAGDELLVRVTRTTSFDAAIEIYRPDGTWLHGDYFSEPYDNTLDTILEPGHLTVNGTYTIIVRDGDRGGMQTGNYDIFFDVLRGQPGYLSIASIDPPQGLHAVGFVGGPFNPPSAVFALQNSGTQSIDWTLADPPNWLLSSSQGGSIEPGGSSTVTVSLSPDAQTLPVGTYTDTLTFTNTTQLDRTILRSVSLMVNPIRGILEVTPAEHFAASGPVHGPFAPSSKTYTLRNVGEEPLPWRAASDSPSWLLLSNESGILQPQGQSGDTATVVVSVAAENLARGPYTGRVTFTNTDNHVGDTERDVLLSIGIEPSTISCNLSKESIVLGEPLRISGRIEPKPEAAHEGVSVELIPASGPTVYLSTNADINGDFFLDVNCSDVTGAGSWSVQTSWSGDEGHLPATSTPASLTVLQARSSLTLDIVMSEAIKINNKPPIGGNFSPTPQCKSTDLAGTPITLRIIEPDSTEQLISASTNQNGQFLLDYDATGFAFDKLGEWTIVAEFGGNDDYDLANSETITVRVVPTAGYAIIIQGKSASSEGLASHIKTANFVYERLIERQLLPDDIEYFGWDTENPNLDAPPSKTAIETAITQTVKNKMITNAGDLYIVALNHGWTEPGNDDVGVFYNDPYGSIRSSELSGWLDQLQDGLEGTAAQDRKIIVVLGFCRAGAFIDDIYGTNRVIIASAAKDEYSHRGPKDVNEKGEPLRDGEYFVSEFFKGVAYGKSIKQCFEDAATMTEAFTSTGSGIVNAPYFDDAVQHPLLDDNWDGVASNELSSLKGEDGHNSGFLFIGTSPPTGNDPGDVLVTQVAEAQFLGVGDTTVNLWAKVDDPNDVRIIWAEVKPPNYDPGDPGAGFQIEMDTFKKPTVAFSNGRFEWNDLGGGSDPADLFSTSGTYQVFYFVKDNTTGNVSPLMESRVYKARAEQDNAPPASFSLISPKEGESHLTTLVLDWEDTTDPDGDQLTYTVLLSKGDSTFNNPVRKAGLEYSTCLVSPADGIEDLSDYYWKVQAIDEYGAIRETGVTMFHTNNTNPVTAWIKGHVYDAISGQSIANAVVSVGNVKLTSALGGYYLGLVVPGKHTITATATGYTSGSPTEVMIPDAAMVTKDFALVPLEAIVLGNIDGDPDVDLADAILALQVMAGIQPSATIYLEGDVNHDGKIGVEEVIYILQKVALLRE